jgi:endonuclease-3
MGGRIRNSTPQRPVARRFVPKTPEDVAALGARLTELWPNAVVELDHRDAYQLLVATILAAQSTDKMINTVTPALFAKYPDAAALAQADQAELEQMVRSTGYFRMKAKYLIEMARAVVERHGGQIPDTMEALCALPGVARKTANVVLGCALGKNEGFIVDTHVTRLAARLGLTQETDPVKIEQDLMALVPRDQWTHVANRLIWHGRRVCEAKKPNCEQCTLAPLCPSFGTFAQAAEAAAPPPSAPAARGDKAAKTDKADKADKAAKSERTAMNEKAAKNARSDQPASRDPRAAKPAAPAKPAKPPARGRARAGARA